MRTASVFGYQCNESEVRGSAVGPKKRREVRKLRGGGLRVNCGGSGVVGMSAQVCPNTIIHQFVDQASLGWPESRYLERGEKGRAEAKKRQGEKGGTGESDSESLR